MPNTNSSLHFRAAELSDGSCFRSKHQCATAGLGRMKCCGRHEEASERLPWVCDASPVYNMSGIMWDACFGMQVLHQMLAGRHHKHFDYSYQEPVPTQLQSSSARVSLLAVCFERIKHERVRGCEADSGH